MRPVTNITELMREWEIPSVLRLCGIHVEESVSDFELLEALVRALPLMPGHRVKNAFCELLGSFPGLSETSTAAEIWQVSAKSLFAYPMPPQPLLMDGTAGLFDGMFALQMAEVRVMSDATILLSTTAKSWREWEGEIQKWVVEHPAGLFLSLSENSFSVQPSLYHVERALAARGQEDAEAILSAQLCRALCQACRARKLPLLLNCKEVTPLLTEFLCALETRVGLPSVILVSERAVCSEAFLRFAEGERDVRFGVRAEDWTGAVAARLARIYPVGRVVCFEKTSGKTAFFSVLSVK